MKQITVTLDLEDDMAAFLEDWVAYSPVPPHPRLTTAEKLAVCLHEFMCRAQTEAMHNEFIDDERRDAER